MTGVLGFLVVRPRLYEAGDPAATLAALQAQQLLVGAGIALELGIVLTQALAALWLFRLFREVDAVSATAVLVFGMVNATFILASAAMLTVARGAAADAGGLDAIQIVGTASLMSEGLWEVAALFFGLWLIPLGLLVLRSGWMPRLLGWFLVVGGTGYALSAFAAALLPEATLAATILSAPANIGEFWLLGYLIVFGARPRTVRARREDAERTAI
ncbi:DUF4386 domain-containing protein [Microbacterium sp. NIBRBAC000506063]|nr:DUF4386 domain-containing protein [Microbacterium sp. NIBRBAC000506063]